MEKRRKNYLYIDANVFVRLHFNLKALLSQLNELSYNIGEDFIILTNSILKGEFIKHYETESTEAKTKLKFPLFQNFSKELERIRNKVSAQSGESVYKDFLSKFPCENIDASIPWTDVFNDYFSNSVPFDKINKKNEFPDAFVFKLLEKYVNSKKRLFIISHDNDFIKWVEQLNKNNVKAFNGLPLFRDHCIKNFTKDPARKLFLSNYLKNVNKIKNDIKKRVEENIFNQEILHKANSTSDWIDFKKVLDIELLKILLLGVDEEENVPVSCLLEVPIKFNYTADAFEYIYQTFGRFHYHNGILRRWSFLEKSKINICLLSLTPKKRLPSKKEVKWKSSIKKFQKSKDF